MAIAAVIAGRPRDLGGFQVRRLLPAGKRQTVGPFIFFDHMGPAIFEPGSGIDVRPHPHIGLATITYLFEGELMHRDSLGTASVIRPGEVNWMVAGKGIVHSERTPRERRSARAKLHGIQTWIALPRADEEIEPSFEHHSASELSEWYEGGAISRLIAGEAYGAQSPVSTYSPMFYVDVQLPTGASVAVPDDHEERAVYVAVGEVELAGSRHAVGELVVLEPGSHEAVTAVARSRVLLLGGARLDGARYIWWNFVSSSLERIEQAKQDWRRGGFDPVPGDPERVPLPES